MKNLLKTTKTFVWTIENKNYDYYWVLDCPNDFLLRCKYTTCQYLPIFIQLYPHVVYSLFNNWADKKGCLYTSGANFASLLPKYDDKMNEANLLSYQCYASVSCIPSYDVH